MLMNILMCGRSTVGNVLFSNMTRRTIGTNLTTTMMRNTNTSLAIAIKFSETIIDINIKVLS